MAALSNSDHLRTIVMASTGVVAAEVMRIGRSQAYLG